MPLKDRNPRAYEIVGLALKVHRTLGRGFVEGVYGDAFELELKQAGIPYEREKKIEVFYNGVKLDSYYVADFICYGEIIVELKAISRLTNGELAQTMNYLKGTGLPCALLLNFGEDTLRHEYLTQDVFLRPRKSASPHPVPAER